MAGLQLGGQLVEHFVASGVIQHIIDQTELVNVDEAHHRLAVTLMRTRQRIAHPQLKLVTVEQAGHRVMRGAPGQLF